MIARKKGKMMTQTFDMDVNLILLTDSRKDLAVCEEERIHLQIVFIQRSRSFPLAVERLISKLCLFNSSRGFPLAVERLTSRLCLFKGSRGFPLA